jgi:FAD/FMN-containing dehydrogenase
MRGRRDFLKLASALAFFGTGCAVSAEGEEVDALGADLGDASTFPASVRTSGRLLTPQSATYTAARTVENPRVDVKPALIAICNTEEEVAASVKWARANGRKITVRSGGHNYEGFSMNSDLVIDVSGLKAFKLNADTMTIGSGWKQGDLAARLFAARPNTAAVMGSCKTVALSGFSLGGGFGFLSRKHGLGVDNIVSLRVVNADGEVLAVNEKENAELFWAMRGGGGSFGVVTQIEYRVHTVPAYVTTFHRSFPIASATTIVPKWFEWVRDMPPELVSIMSMSGSGASAHVSISGQYLGSPDEFLAAVKATWGDTFVGNFTKRTFLDAVDHFNGGKVSAKSSRFRARSDYYTKPLNAEGIATITRVLVNNKDPWSLAFLFDSYGPAIRNVEPNAMAFAHRKDILCCMQLYMSWGGTQMGPNANDARAAARIKEIGAVLTSSGNVSGQAYPNYTDTTRDDWASAYYGQNLPRLQQAKKAYDPTNYFSFAQSIPMPA